MNEILQTAAILAPSSVIEVRALADGVTHSGYFDDYERLARAVEALDADPAVAGIYVTLNTPNPALLARRANRIKMRLSRKDATTADADIVRRRWFPIDIDPVRPSGVSSTDEEHDAALNAADRIAGYLAEQGFPSPIKADSGNGAHLLYRIDLENDETATALVKGALTTLDALFSNETITVDTANYNAARIWKLYGTLSRKGDSTEERPHRRAKILAAPEEMVIVPVERLQHLAGLLPRDEPPRSKNTAGIDLAAWLAEHGIAVRSTRPWQGGTLYVLAECPFSSAHRDGAFAIQFANGAVFAGCHHATCGGGAQRWPELRGMYEPKRTPKREKKEQEEKPTPPPIPDEYRERALEILRTGDPLAFLLDTFNRSHVGDRTVAECLVMSLASQSVENTNGLHVSISGNSGKGKSHACTTMLRQIPEEYRLAGTVSDKALYYNDGIQPGTAFLFDDVSLSDDLQEVLKSATANFREQIEHQTVTPDRKLQICRIPERCVWWLAKVEDAGDDQVMNRMLTVWIDDSAEQDARVLRHIKEVEAREGAGDEQENNDLLTARAIWTILKEEMLHVSVPYARSIQFSNAGNRRNPGILFDLIKCHALLFRFQREKSASGIRANRDDFFAAARVYAAINGEAGGQETKLTKNEAAALSTVAMMGWEQFTARMLQEALGLSYQQTYRILHGYVSRGTTYSGLLAKCPAISYVDALFTEDNCGYTVRRRENLFSFDLEVYRQWARGAEVWLDDGGDQDGDPGPDDSFSITAGLQQNFSRCCKDHSPQNGAESGNTGTERDASLSTDHNIQQKRNPHSSIDLRVSEGVHVCEPRNAVTTAPITPDTSTNGNSLRFIRPFDFSTLRKPLKTTESGGGLLKASAGGTVPLPGVLVPPMFERTKVELGRCDVCGERKAVYRSQEARTTICEGCYSRLVREWNRGEGVR
ncbi:hypothetical protein [Methanoculleus sp. 10]|uniref:hypothetical protein n=1 Tax=Methanoculleus sp. 10 TaxID=430615 RepID=UPI0025DB1B68|nr:hypothetical protein [Methanoculleus sp. 10]